MAKFTDALVTALVLLLPSVGFGQWYGSVDFIVPSRTNGGPNQFQTNIIEQETTDDTGAVISTDYIVGTDTYLSYDLGFVSGGRATVGYQRGLGGLEASFMTTDQWQTRASVSDANGLLASPFSLPGFDADPLLDFNTFAAVRYETKMTSAEINLTYLAYDDAFGRQGICKFGMRGIAIDESFEYSSLNAAGSNRLTSNVNNRLIGPQVALQGTAPAPGGQILLGMSGLLAYNDIDREIAFNGTTANADTGEASLAGELSIEYLVIPYPNMAVRVGYQMLAISNVGLASDDPLMGGKQTDGLIYGIPYAGIMITR